MNNFDPTLSSILENILSLYSVFSMSKLLQKHVVNHWVKSWDMLEIENIKF